MNDEAPSPETGTEDIPKVNTALENTTPEVRKKRKYVKSPRGFSYTLAAKAKKELQKKIREREKLIANLDTKKARLKEKKQALSRITEALSTSTKSKVVTEEQIEKAPPTLKEEIQKEENVLFKPNPGPQTDFLAAPETDVLYGGAAGGGKSFAMLVDPLRFADNAAHRALLLRRTMPELMELIDVSKRLYKQAFPKATFRESEKRWIFPSGATLQFGYLDRDDDVTRYQGQAFSWIGIDELTHYPTPYVWNYLRSRLRRTDLRITPYMRATTNPGGVGSWWVKQMYIDPSTPGEPFWATDIESGKTLVYANNHPDPELRGKPLFKRKFIPARLTDNPYLMQSGEYMAMLSSLPEVERLRLLEGDWNVSENSAFPEFNIHTHTLTPVEFNQVFRKTSESMVKIPPNWSKFRSCDFGYAQPTAVLWFAVAPDGTLFVYREFYSKGYNSEQLAHKILELEAYDVNVNYGVLDSQCWEAKGNIGPSIAEEMITRGVRWRKSDKGPGSRINGKLEVHRRLSIDPMTQKPGLLILNTCKNLIRTMQSLPLDTTNHEDVDTDAEDHAYDALRYGITSRPSKRATFQTKISTIKRDTYTPFDDRFGY